MRHNSGGVVLLAASTRRWLPRVTLPIVLAGCMLHGKSQSSQPASSDDIVITRDDIGRMQGVQTAWDVLLRRLPARFTSRGGIPTYESHRGPAPGRSTPLLVLDGVQIDDWRQVITIPVESIEAIRLLGTISGGILYGRDARACVIMVETIPRS
jgi:hypothetical protein